MASTTRGRSGVKSPAPASRRRNSASAPASETPCYANNPHLFGGPLRWAGTEKKLVVDRLSSQGWLPGEDPGIIASTLSQSDSAEKVRRALMAYQNFFRLTNSPPGELDQDTKNSLLAPRFCGLPDVMPMATALGAWGIKDIAWAMNVSDWPRIGRDAAVAAFTQAWAQWAEVCDLRPKMASPGSPANVVTTVGQIDGPFNVLAYSQIPGAGFRGQLTQQFDQSESWAVGGNLPNGLIDLVAVACHEIGHVIGIPHIQTGNLMAPIYNPLIRKPVAGDVAEGRARYGSPQTTPPVNPPVDPPVTPPAGGASSVIVEVELQVQNGRAVGWKFVGAK